MAEDYMDDKFKKILESPPSFEPDENAIADMRKRLRDSKRKDRKGAWWLLLLPLLFLPLLLGGWYTYQQQNLLHKQVAHLTQQLDYISKKETSTIEKEIIHHYDTIYNVIYRTQYLEAPQSDVNQQKSYFNSLAPRIVVLPTSAFWNTNTQMGSDYYSSFNVSSKLLSALPPALKGESLPVGVSVSRNHFFEKYNPFNNSNTNAPFQEPTSSDFQKYGETFLLDKLDFGLLSDPLFPNLNKADSLEIFEIPPTTASPILYCIPNGFSLGLKGSAYVHPFHDYGGSGANYGLVAEIHFPQNRSISIGLEYFNFNFEQKDPVSSPFPIVDPTDPTDVLHEVKGNFSYLQIPILFKQSFRRGKNLKPYFSLGMVAYRPIQQAFKYEYINGLGEYKLSDTFNEGTFAYDNLRVGLGANYLLGRQFSISADVNYQHGFSSNTGEYFPLRYFDSSLGLFYRFR